MLGQMDAACVMSICSHHYHRRHHQFSFYCKNHLISSPFNNDSSFLVPSLHHMSPNMPQG